MGAPLNTMSVTNASYRSDGIPEIRVKVKSGYKPGFATTGWTVVSTYQVAVTEDEPFASLIEKVRAQAGPKAKLDKMFAVNNKGDVLPLDFSKSCAENGLTTTKVVELRYPASL